MHVVIFVREGSILEEGYYCNERLGMAKMKNP